MSFLFASHSEFSSLDVDISLQSEQFQQELRDIYRQRVPFILSVTMGVLCFCMLLDYLVQKEAPYYFFVFRLVAIGTVAVLLVVSRLDRRGRFSLPIGVFSYLCVISAVLLALWHREVGSSYYVALIVTQVWFVSLNPFSAIQALGYGLLPSLAYLGAALWWQNAGQTHFVDIFHNVFFMLSFVVISSIQSWAGMQFRFRAYLQRQDEKQAGERLEAQIRSMDQEARRRLAAQQTAEKQYQLRYASIPDALALVAPDGLILQVNEVCLRSFYAGDLPADASLLDLVPASDHDQLRSRLLEPLSWGESIPAWSGVLISTLGRQVSVEISGALLPYAGAGTALLLLLRDIGPRRAREQKMAAALTRVQHTERKVLLALASISEYRAKSPGRHLQRLQEYCRLLAEGLARCPGFGEQISPAYVQMLQQGAVLYDIGMVTLPDEILRKDSPLEEHEALILRRHTTNGGNLIRQMEAKSRETGFLTLARNIACFHHEHWDGSGYPSGLAGEAIPLEARIVALADAYDTLTAGPVPQTHQQAAQYLLGKAGQRFDPLLVEVFLLHQGSFEQRCRSFEADA